MLFRSDKAGRGTVFFTRILEDPAIVEVFKTEWTKFRGEKYPVLVEYIREYAETIRESHASDQKRWNQSRGSVDRYRDELLEWLDKRVVYMDGFFN